MVDKKRVSKIMTNVGNGTHKVIIDGLEYNQDSWYEDTNGLYHKIENGINVRMVKDFTFKD